MHVQVQPLLPVRDGLQPEGGRPLRHAGRVHRGCVRPRFPAADAVAARIQGTTDFGELKHAELVVEAVFENLEVKQDVFRKLSDACGPDTILATNTSSFFVRDVAEVV